MFIGPVLGFLAFLLLRTNAHKVPKGYTPPQAHCVDYMVPVTVSSEDYQWVGPRWTDNFGLTEFVTTAVTRPAAGLPPPFGNPAAVNAGYSVFFYDRLGTGNSTKISGYVNQINIQVSILAVLTKNIRAGQFTGEIGVPSSVVLVGHSFGSFTSNALVAAQPLIVDGIVMTGYSLNGGNTQIIFEGSRVAAIQNRKRFGELDSGYITSADVYSTVSDFFKAPDYERDVAVFAESSKAPYAIAELISISPPFVPPLNASLFNGPGLVISGEYDSLLCGGYCPGVIRDPLTAYFAGSKDFELFIQPGAGHGLNFALNATDAYSTIFSFLNKNF
ncbi:MAG: hypothetical protein Q9167_005432 [Letrouitia subvulpina]